MASRAAKKDTPAPAGHNVKDEREAFIEQQFLNGLGQIKGIKSNIAFEMGAAKDVYARVKPFGYTPSDFKWALELEDKDSASIISMWERRLKIAKWLGHGVARQFEMFDEDRTPLEDRAYEEGLAAGKMRKDANNPYGMDSPAGQRWQSGMNDGTAFANMDLSDAMTAADELIKAGGDDADPFDDGQKIAAE